MGTLFQRAEKPRLPEPGYQIELITPERAAEYLATNRADQRRLRPMWVAALARQIEEDLWQYNGQPIIFDSAGNLFDGQHRLSACVKAGRPFLTGVIRGVARDAFDTVDTGMGRTAADVIEIGTGRSYASLLAAFARNYFYVYKCGKPVTAHAPRVSYAELRKIVAAHPEWDESAKIAATIRFGGSGGLYAFMHWEFAKRDRILADEYYNAVARGANLINGHPALAVRERLAGMFRAGESRRSTRGVQQVILIRGWNALRENRPLHRVLARTGDEVPEIV